MRIVAIRNLFWVVLLGAAFPLSAVEDEKLESLTVGNRTYTNVVVTGRTSTDLYIRHSGGMANIKLRYLEPELREKFGYDPEAEQRNLAKSAKGSPLKNLLGSKSPPKPAPRPVAKPAAKTELKPAERVWAKRFMGSKGPEFVTEGWATAKPRMDQKFMVLVFFSTEDDVSRKAFPLLNQIQRKFGNRLAVVGLTPEPVAEVQKKDLPTAFFIASDPQDRMKSAAQVTAYPHAMIMDPAGIVRWEGAVENNQLSESLVQEVLDKFSPPAGK